jgi:hypothetical protein
MYENGDITEVEYKKLREKLALKLKQPQGGNETPARPTRPKPEQSNETDKQNSPDQTDPLI